MLSPTLVEIERTVRNLPIEDQLWLLERIARRLRESTSPDIKFANAEQLESQLAAMANDPAIQHELAAIEREFAVAEADGLEHL